jgi:hypothetical protein
MYLTTSFFPGFFNKLMLSFAKDYGTPNSDTTLRSHQVFFHSLVLLVIYARITAGVGLIDSHTMLGSDRHVCESLWQVFPLLLLSLAWEETTLNKPLL